MKKEEYTYADVIIDPNDERVEIGERYYMGDSPNIVLERANEAKDFAINTLVKIDNEDWDPFLGGNQGCYCCLIKPKAIRDGYVPYDLSNKEVRDKLRGQWIVRKGSDAERLITSFTKDSYGSWSYDVGFGGGNNNELLANYTFLDGTPCGEKVEE